MDGMSAAPAIIGRERENPEPSADPVVDLTLAEKGAVSAIVLDHEKADQETGRRNRQHQTPPKAMSEGRPRK